ncbi:lipopolysaccharide biosynthesis protein [Undibacterium sp. SXout7W]|uniref:lipopolysaccharide biosynthesis protein n=1 Tax=Undibacterium sp. SXout7W TaxID=3413049 RepID=UPI003BEF4CEF
MGFHKKFLSSSILSVIDQGMLSALNFAIGALLIRLVNKDDYGLYGQLYAGGLLVGLVVDSWIAGPLTTVASAVHENTRKRLLRRYWYRQIFWTLAMAFLAFAAVEFLPAVTHYSNKSWLLGTVFAAYLIGNGLREYSRTVGFIQSDIPSVLRQDVLYAGLVVSGLAIIYTFFQVELVAVFIVLALSSLLCILLTLKHLMARTTAIDVDDAEDMQVLASHQETIRGHGRWAVLGVIVGWLSNYSYVYLSGAWLGLSAIADLNASRLLLMPIPLAVAAWSRVARPEASRLMAAQNWAGLRKLTLLSIGVIELVVLAYVIVLLLALPWLEDYVIGSKYSGLDPLVMLWGGYFAVNAARWVGTSWLSSGGAFRSMFILGSVTLALVITITSVSIPRWGSAGAILALIAVELFELIVVWKFILPRLQKAS